MSKICLRCSTVNLDNFSFCKYCGAPLPTIERKTTVFPPEVSADGYANNISDAEYTAFVGKNADKIVRRFNFFSATERKTSWCFPVLILGVFFGFFGMATYFFLRKMPKIGLILTLCGVVLVGSELVLNLDADREFLRAYHGVIESVMQNPDIINNLDEVEEQIAPAFKVYLDKYNPAVSLIDRYLVRTVIPVFLSSYASYLYFLTANKRIKELKEKGHGRVEYTDLTRAGGLSVGMAFIPVAVSLLCSVIRAVLMLI